MPTTEPLKIRKSIDWSRIKPDWRTHWAEIEILMRPTPIAEFTIIKSIDWSRIGPEPDGRRHVHVQTIGHTETGYCNHSVTISATQERDGSVYVTGFGAA